MHYMLVNQLHSHYIQHVMYVITYPLHAFEDANVIPTLRDSEVAIVGCTLER